MNKELKKINVRKKSRTGLVVAVIVLALLVLAALSMGIGYLYYHDALKPVDAENTQLVGFEVAIGASASEIADDLESAGLIKSAFVFRTHTRLQGGQSGIVDRFARWILRVSVQTDGSYKSGSYELSKSESVEEIMNILITGTKDKNVARFTIPEGYTIRQTMDVLVAEGLADPDVFMDEVRSGAFDYAFLSDVPAGDDRLEGFLYPETYEVYLDASEHEIIDKMLAQFDLLFKQEYYTRAAERGMRIRDVVTLASVIERESVAAEERPIMSGVFQNRLLQGMPLQSCATIQYILGEPKEFLSIADTQIESPYNTYLHPGLPPGPICSPRIQSIEAVLYPDENDYLYFVLSETLDGTHHFSADYAQFERDKAAYYRAAEGR